MIQALKVVKREPNQELIKILEDTLEDAKKGEIVSLVLIGEVEGGRLMFTKFFEEDANVATVIGGMESMKSFLSTHYWDYFE